MVKEKKSKISFQTDCFNKLVKRIELNLKSGMPAETAIRLATQSWQAETKIVVGEAYQSQAYMQAKQNKLLKEIMTQERA